MKQQTCIISSSSLLLVVETALWFAPYHKASGAVFCSGGFFYMADGLLKSVAPAEE